MKIAVLADIHANLEALEAVLADLGDWPDQIIVAGDLIGYGPDPNAVVARLRETGARCIWGNHEGMVFGRLGMRRCIYAGIRAVLWTRKVLDPEARRWLEALPFDLEIAPGIFMVHADPRDSEKYINSAQLAGEALGAVSANVRVLIVGHTHEPIFWNGGVWTRTLPGAHRLDGRMLLNPGAVGQSRNERRVACYARLDLAANKVTFHELEYPWQQTARKMKAAGLVPLLSAPSSSRAQRLFDSLRARWLRWNRVLWPILGIMVALVIIYTATIKDFLAINRPVHGEILVVESWYNVTPTLQDAVSAIRQGQYRKVVCVALVDPSDPQGGGERAARYLTGMGIDPEMLQVLNVPYVEKYRTYSTAMAVRHWQQQEFPDVRSIDVFTKSIHARKSMMLYRKIFPEPLDVGIIAGQAEPFPRSRWWLSGRGIYLILRNTIGCLHALIITPPDSAVPSALKQPGSPPSSPPHSRSAP